MRAFHKRIQDILSFNDLKCIFNDSRNFLQHVSWLFFTSKKFHPRWLLLIIHMCGTHVNVRQNRNVWVGLSYFRKKHIYSLFMLSKLFFVNYCFIISFQLDIDSVKISTHLNFSRDVRRKKVWKSGGHCALNRVLRGHFLGNQDVAVKYKSEVIFVKFW